MMICVLEEEDEGKDRERKWGSKAKVARGWSGKKSLVR